MNTEELLFQARIATMNCTIASKAATAEALANGFTATWVVLINAAIRASKAADAARRAYNDAARRASD